MTGCERWDASRVLSELSAAGRQTIGQPEEVMNWQRRLAALLVMLALAGCAQGTAGQAGAPYAPYSPREQRDQARARRRGWRRRWRHVAAAECRGALVIRPV